VVAGRGAAARGTLRAACRKASASAFIAEEDHARRPRYTDPEILRSSLAAVILRMASLELGAVDEFPFLEPPPPRAIADGYQLLQELGAVDANRALTPLGRELARLPLDPAHRPASCLPRATKDACRKRW
jgi:ATP-dependent helicase HrpA